MHFTLVMFLLFSQVDLTIQEIQGGGDSSPYVGQHVRTRGVVTGVYHRGAFVQDTAGGPWSGIWLADSSLGVARGDFIVIDGWVREYYNLTEIERVTLDSIIGHGYAIEPETLTTGEAANEMWEGVLITVEGATCESLPNRYGEWYVNDGTGLIMIDDLGYPYHPVLGNCYTITGPLYYSYGQYKIEPRDANDVFEVTCPIRFSSITFTPTLPDPDDSVTVIVTIHTNSTVVADSLYYTTGGEWTSVPHDSLENTTYYYTIPNQPVGTRVRFYLSYWREDSTQVNSDTLMYMVPDFSQPIPLILAHILDLNGVSILEGRTIQFTGKLTTGGELGRTYFLQDTSGGIAIYNPGVSLSRGDSVVGTGTVESYYGLAELKNVNFSLIQPGEEPHPLVVNCRELSENGERYEGMLLRINGVTSSATYFPSDGTISITDSTGTFTLFIDRDTDLAGLPVPSGSFDIIGVLSQHDNSPPYTEGYQLVPRSHGDVIFSGDGSGEVYLIPPISFPGDTDTLHFIIRQSPGNIRIVFPRSLQWSFDDTELELSVEPDSIVFDENAGIVTIFTNIDSLTIDILNVVIPDTTGDFEFMVKTSSGSSFRRVMFYPTLFVVSPISEVQGTGYTSPYVGDTMRVGGWVIGPSDVFSPSGKTTFWIYDGTGGIECFSYSVTAPIKLGDFVVVRGMVNEYNGLTQITFDPENLLKVYSELTNYLPAPDTLEESQPIGEELEGHFISVTGTVANSPYRGGSGFNFTILNGLTPIDVRVVDATGIDAGSIRKGQVLRIKGIVSQYDPTEPYTSGYQIMPVRSGDIEVLQGVVQEEVELLLDRSVVVKEDGTTFRIEVRSPSTAENTLVVYDLEGRKVKTLTRRHTGPLIITWDTLDEYGVQVKLGMYIIQLRSTYKGKTKVINKLVLVTRRFR